MIDTTREAHDSGVCVYRIDAADYIRYVSPAWDQFAVENQGQHLVHRVIGSSLWRHIGGLEVRAVYRLLLQRLRTSEQRPIRFPFRADSPTLRRYMEMVVTPLPNGGIEFRCQSVREEPRRNIALLDPAIARSEKRIILCALCKALHAHREWMELDEAVRISSVFDGGLWPHMDHDLCPSCRKLLQ